MAREESSFRRGWASCVFRHAQGPSMHNNVLPGQSLDLFRSEYQPITKTDTHITEDNRSAIQRPGGSKEKYKNPISLP